MPFCDEGRTSCRRHCVIMAAMLDARLLRALVVEDQFDDRELILQELRRGGFVPECEFVRTAHAFTAALSKSRWDVILSDYSVPGFGGRQALEALKSTGLDIPFIVVSGAIGDEVAAALMRMGANDCIDKHSRNRIAPAVDRELKEYAN